MSVTDERGEVLHTDYDFVVLHRRNSCRGPVAALSNSALFVKWKGSRCFVVISFLKYPHVLLPLFNSQRGNCRLT
jgi:hypothetical protein